MTGKVEKERERQHCDRSHANNDSFKAHKRMWMRKETNKSQ